MKCPSIPENLSHPIVSQISSNKPTHLFPRSSSGRGSVSWTSRPHCQPRPLCLSWICCFLPSSLKLCSLCSLSPLIPPKQLQDACVVPVTLSWLNFQDPGWLYTSALYCTSTLPEDALSHSSLQGQQSTTISCPPQFRSMIFITPINFS